jgi:hypothetical protein
VDTVELTDLIKDLEATLNDMRKLPPGSAPAIAAPPELVEKEGPGTMMLREYGRTGRVIKPKPLLKEELHPGGTGTVVRLGDLGRKPVTEVKQEAAEAKPGALKAGEAEKAREIPTAGKEVAVRGSVKTPPEEEDARSGYLTPEGFVIKKMRP